VWGFKLWEWTRTGKASKLASKNKKQQQTNNKQNKAKTKMIATSDTQTGQSEIREKTR
jgi:hypothetical protein